jgi:hypothetical protein
LHGISERLLLRHLFASGYRSRFACSLPL